MESAKAYQLSSTRQRPVSAADALWLMLKENVTAAHPEVAANWRVARQIEAPCTSCPNPGGVVIKCSQDNCMREYHIWCAPSTNGLALLGHGNLQFTCDEHITPILFCTCQQPYDDSIDMVSCDKCSEWFHCKCVRVDQSTVAHQDFICSPCRADDRSAEELQMIRQNNEEKERIVNNRSETCQGIRQLLEVEENVCPLIDVLLGESDGIQPCDIKNAIDTLMKILSNDDDSLAVLAALGMDVLLQQWLTELEECQASMIQHEKHMKEKVTMLVDKLAEILADADLFNEKYVLELQVLCEDIVSFADSLSSLVPEPTEVAEFETCKDAIVWLSEVYKLMHSSRDDCAAQAEELEDLVAQVSDIRTELEQQRRAQCCNLLYPNFKAVSSIIESSTKSLKNKITFALTFATERHYLDHVDDLSEIIASLKRLPIDTRVLVSKLSALYERLSQIERAANEILSTTEEVDVPHLKSLVREISDINLISPSYHSLVNAVSALELVERCRIILVDHIRTTIHSAKELIYGINQHIGDAKEFQQHRFHAHFSQYLVECNTKLMNLVSCAQDSAKQFFTSDGDIITTWNDRPALDTIWREMQQNVVVNEAEMAITFYTEANRFLLSSPPSTIDELSHMLAAIVELLRNNVALKFPSTIEVYKRLQVREREWGEMKERATRNWRELSEIIHQLFKETPCTYEVFESLLNKAMADNIFDTEINDKCAVIRLATEDFTQTLLKTISTVDQALLRSDMSVALRLENLAAAASTLPLRKTVRDALDSRIMMEKCIRHYVDTYRLYATKIGEGSEIAAAYEWIQTQTVNSDAAYTKCRGINVLVDDRLVVGHDLLAMLFNIKNDWYYISWRMRAQQVLTGGEDIREIDELINEATLNSAKDLIESSSEWSTIQEVHARLQPARDRSNGALASFYDAKNRIESFLSVSDIFADNVSLASQAWRQEVVPTKLSINESLQVYYAQRKASSNTSRKVLLPVHDISRMESAIAEISIIEKAVAIVDRIRKLKTENTNLDKVTLVDLVSWTDIELILKQLKGYQDMIAGSSRVVEYFISLFVAVEEKGNAWIARAKTMVPVQSTRKQKASAKTYTIAHYRELLDDPLCWTIDIPHFPEVYDTYNKAVQHLRLYQQLMFDENGTSSTVNIREVDYDALLNESLRSIPHLLEEIKLSPVDMPEIYILEWAQRAYEWALTLHDQVVSAAPDEYGVENISIARNRLIEGNNVMSNINEDTIRALTSAGLIILSDPSNRSSYEISKVASLPLKIARTIFNNFSRDVAQTESWERTTSVLIHTKPRTQELLEKMEAAMVAQSKLKILPDTHIKKQLERTIELIRNGKTNVSTTPSPAPISTAKRSPVIPTPVKPEDYRPKSRKNDDDEFEVVDVDASDSAKHKRKHARSATSSRKQPREDRAQITSATLPVEHICASKNCKWVVAEGSKYCSDECALRDVHSLFDSLLDFRCFQLQPNSNSTSSANGNVACAITADSNRTAVHDIYRRGVSAFGMMMPDDIAKRFEMPEEGHSSLQNVFQDHIVKNPATITSNGEANNTRRIILAAFPDCGARLLDEYYKSNELYAGHQPINGELRSQVRETIEDVIVQGLLRGSIDNGVTSGAILACDIEEEMYNRHGCLSTPALKKEYRKHQLMLIRNLKHHYNVPLIIRLHKGEVNVRELLGMTTDQLNDPKIQEQRDLESREALQSMVMAKSTQAMIAERIQETLQGDADKWRDSGKIMLATAEDISAAEASIRGTVDTKEEVAMPIRKVNPPIDTQLRKSTLISKAPPTPKPPTKPVDVGVIENISKRQRIETSVPNKSDVKLTISRPVSPMDMSDQDFASFAEVMTPPSVASAPSSRSLKVKPVSELMNSLHEELDEGFAMEVEEKPKTPKSSLLSVPPTPAVPVQLLSSAGTTLFTIHRPVGANVGCSFVGGIVDCRSQGIIKQSLNIDGLVRFNDLCSFITETLAKGKKVVAPFIFVLANKSPANVDAYRNICEWLISDGRVGLCHCEKNFSQLYVIPPKMLPKIPQIANMLPGCLQVQDENVHWMFGLVWSQAVGPLQFTHAQHQPFHVHPPETQNPAEPPSAASNNKIIPDKQSINISRHHTEPEKPPNVAPISPRDTISAAVRQNMNKVLNLLEETGDVDKALQKLISKTNKDKIPFLFQGEAGHEEFCDLVEQLKTKLARAASSGSKVDSTPPLSPPQAAIKAPTTSHKPHIFEPKEVKLSEATRRCCDNLVRLLQFHGREGVRRDRVKPLYSKQFGHELTCDDIDGHTVSVSTVMAGNRDIVGVSDKHGVTYYHRDFAPKLK